MDSARIAAAIDSDAATITALTAFGSMCASTLRDAGTPMQRAASSKEQIASAAFLIASAWVG